MSDMAEPAVEHVEIKIVGKSGQISLGKKYTGKTLRLERRADGTVVLTPVAMVPETQLWTLQEPDRARIERGFAWAVATEPRETDLDRLTVPPRKRAGRARGRRR